jgi:hypothetical protein
LPSSSAIRRLRSQAVWREAGGEVIAIDDRLTTYVSTDGAGAILWAQLAGGASPADLAARLVATYSIESDRAERDVAAFLAELDEMGFLEP